MCHGEIWRKHVVFYVLNRCKCKYREGTYWSYDKSVANPLQEQYTVFYEWKKSKKTNTDTRTHVHIHEKTIFLFVVTIRWVIIKEKLVNIASFALHIEIYPPPVYNISTIRLRFLNDFKYKKCCFCVLCANVIDTSTHFDEKGKQKYNVFHQYNNLFILLFFCRFSIHSCISK